MAKFYCIRNGLVGALVDAKTEREAKALCYGLVGTTEIKKAKRLK